MQQASAGWQILSWQHGVQLHDCVANLLVIQPAVLLLTKGTGHFGGVRLCVYVCGAIVAVAVAVSLCVAVSTTIELAGCMADRIFVGRRG